MIFIVSRYLIPKGYRGITVFPFIVVRSQTDRDDRVTINHERIHVRQQLELLIIPFFIWYGIEYLVRLLYYRNSGKAYRNIVFEREAYTAERDIDYLRKRKIWQFLRFY